MSPFLVVRPEPGASATADRIRAWGGEAIVAPLFEVEPRDWEPSPPEAHDALIITSAHAARQAGEALARYRGLPAYAVGAATGAALSEAGFADVRVGAGHAEALIALVASEGCTRPLHLAGEDYRPLEAEGVIVTRRIVYGARALDRLPEAARDIPPESIVLLHSPRAARTFAALWDAEGRPRSDIQLAAISPATLAAAGEGWAASVAADAPTDEAVLAAAFALCEADPETKTRHMDGQG